MKPQDGYVNVALFSNTRGYLRDVKEGLECCHDIKVTFMKEIIIYPYDENKSKEIQLNQEKKKGNIVVLNFFPVSCDVEKDEIREAAGNHVQHSKEMRAKSPIQKILQNSVKWGARKSIMKKMDPEIALEAIENILG